MAFGEDGVMTFADVETETLMELIRMHEENPMAQALKSERHPNRGLRRTVTKGVAAGRLNLRPLSCRQLSTTCRDVGY